MYSIYILIKVYKNLKISVYIFLLALKVESNRKTLFDNKNDF